VSFIVIIINAAMIIAAPILAYIFSVIIPVISIAAIIMSFAKAFVNSSMSFKLQNLKYKCILPLNNQPEVSMIFFVSSVASLYRFIISNAIMIVLEDCHEL
jgi:hypothetical protein